MLFSTLGRPPLWIFTFQHGTGIHRWSDPNEYAKFVLRCLSCLDFDLVLLISTFFWGFVGICEKIHGIFVGVILPNLIVFFSSARNARRVAFRLEVFAALNAKWVIRQKPFGILAAGGWNDEVCRKWRRTCGDFVLMYVIPSGEMRVYVLSFCIVVFVWILKNNLKS